MCSFFNIFLKGWSLVRCCILLIKLFYLWNIHSLVLEWLLIIAAVKCSRLNLYLLCEELIILHILCGRGFFIKHFLHKQLNSSILFLSTNRRCITSLINHYCLCLIKLTLSVLSCIVWWYNLNFLWFYCNCWFYLRVLSWMIALILLLRHWSWLIYCVWIGLLLFLSSSKDSICISIRWKTLNLS